MSWNKKISWCKSVLYSFYALDSMTAFLMTMLKVALQMDVMGKTIQMLYCSNKSVYLYIFMSRCLNPKGMATDLLKTYGGKGEKLGPEITITDNNGLMFTA